MIVQFETPSLSNPLKWTFSFEPLKLTEIELKPTQINAIFARKKSSFCKNYAKKMSKIWYFSQIRLLITETQFQNPTNMSHRGKFGTIKCNNEQGNVLIEFENELNFEKIEDLF